MTSISRLLVREVIQRDILLFVQLIGQNRMALREGAAFDSPGPKAGRGSFSSSSVPNARASPHRPIDATPFLNHLAAIRQKPLDRLVQP